ncbi:MAG: hypothetical protein N3F66_12145 [Spirochaetes bacterium]|nr:hypothetical protein [Spirochaetota bacterium]
MNSKVVKRAVIILIIQVLMFTTCSKKKDYSQIENLLNQWANAIKYLNYTDYCRLEANPKDSNTFNVMYQQYYISNIRIVEVDDTLHNGTDSDGKPYEFKNVRFIASLYNRQTNREEQIVNGDIKIIRYVSGPKKEKGWLLSNRTLIYEQ